MTTELTKEWRERAEQAGWTEGEEECFAQMPGTTLDAGDNNKSSSRFSPEAGLVAVSLINRHRSYRF